MVRAGVLQSLTFFPPDLPDWGMLRRSRRVLIFFEKLLEYPPNRQGYDRLLPKLFTEKYVT